MEGTKTDYEQRIADIHAMRTELDAYSKALHKKEISEKSLRQLIDLTKYSGNKRTGTISGIGYQKYNRR